MYNALITGTGGNIGQGIIKAARMSEYDIKIISTDTSAFSSGPYLGDMGYIVPPYDDEKYTKRIIQLCKSENVDIVFIGTDHELIPLSNKKDIIEKETAAKVIVSSKKVIETANDKWETAKFLRDSKLLYPKSAIPKDTEKLEKLKQTAGFPLVVKPRFGSGSKDVITVQNDAELTQAISKVKNPIIQEYLIGDEYTVGTFTNENGKTTGAITMKRELRDGTSYKVICKEYKEIKDTAIKATRFLRPLGPCNFQMRLTESGPFIFEINSRFSSTTPIRAAFGFNSVTMAIKSFTLKEKIGVLNIRKGIAFRYWDEVYVEMEDYRTLTEKKEIPGPKGVIKRVL